MADDLEMTGSGVGQQPSDETIKTGTPFEKQVALFQQQITSGEQAS